MALDDRIECMSVFVDATTAAKTCFGSRVSKGTALVDNSIKLVFTGNISADASNYWSIAIGYSRAGVTSTLATFTTAATAITALAEVAITHAAVSFQPGDYLVVAVSVGAGSPAALASFTAYYPTF